MNMLKCVPVLVVFACARNYPPPTDNLASAIAAARAARTAGAANVPRAALQLKLAEEQLAQAREMMQHGANERADYMSLRAYNDAELALAIARENEVSARAARAQALVTTGTGGAEQR